MIDRDNILAWLRETDESRLEELWARADRVRRESVGDAVHLRGLIEFSNYCVRLCGYCGIRRDNEAVRRYRMTEDEILVCARQAVRFGYGTIVLQSGEDYGATAGWVAGVVRRLRRETSLAITLSLGERRDEETLLWRQAGADRYLLRFETTNHELYERIHPSLGGRASDRFAQLRRLREQGYEIGSGVMVGIPGQSWEDLAEDILRFRDLDLDMIGVGPYIPHPGTPLGRAMAEVSGTCPHSDHDGGAGATPGPRPDGEQVPNDELTTLKAVALTRLVCPASNIPSTTALATIDQAQGRELGLRRGANIVMPNLTPPEYRIAYEIYPGKACVTETAEACHGCLQGRIVSLGRTVGTGRGDSPALRARDARATGDADAGSAVAGDLQE